MISRNTISNILCQLKKKEMAIGIYPARYPVLRVNIRIELPLTRSAGDPPFCALRTDLFVPAYRSLPAVI